MTTEPKHLALVHILQNGVSDLYQVDKFSGEPLGRNAKRLFQDTRSAVEYFAKGLHSAGGYDMKIYCVETLGDSSQKAWYDGERPSGWRIVYGETRPAWEAVRRTKREAMAFASEHRKMGDTVFSIKRVVPGEPPRSMMAAIEASKSND